MELGIRLQEMGWRYVLEDNRSERRALGPGNWKYIEQPNYSSLGWVRQNGQPLLRRDLSKEQRFELDKGLVERGLLSQLIVPLILDGDTIGTLNFSSETVNW